MAAVSKTQLANMALAHIGAKDTIESLTEDSTEAKTVNIWYDHSRRTTLEAYNWSFAKKRQALAVDNEDPPDGVWAFRYQYPADCVVARHLENPTFVKANLFDEGDTTTLTEPDAFPYAIEMSSDGQRKTILTDVEDAILVYTFDQTILDVFTNSAITALSYALANDIAYKLTGKISIKDAMYERFLFTAQRAAARDGNEGIDRPPRDASWIRGRS